MLDNDAAITQLTGTEVESMESKMHEAEEKLRVALERFDELEAFYSQLKAKGGIDKATAISIENYEPGILTKKVNINSFTERTSLTNYDVAMEQLTVSMEEVAMVIAAIFLFIVSIISFIIAIIDAATTGSKRGGLDFKYKTLSDFHIYFNNRTTFIDSHISSENVNKYIERMNSHLESQYGDLFRNSPYYNIMKSKPSASTYSEKLRKFLDEAFSQTYTEKQTELTSLIGNQFNYLFSGLATSDQNRQKLINNIVAHIPNIVNKISDLNGMFEDITTAVDKRVSTVSESRLDDMGPVAEELMKDINVTSRGAATLDKIEGTLSTMGSVARTSAFGRLSVPSSNSKRLFQVIQDSQIIEDGKKRVVYDPKRHFRDPVNTIKAISNAVKDRPLNNIDVKQAKEKFEGINKYFEKMADDSDRVVNSIISDDREKRVNVLRARINKAYLTWTRMVFKDIGAALQAAMIYDQCFTNLLVGADRAYRRDCETYLYAYRTLKNYAPNDAVEKNYQKIHDELTEEYEKYKRNGL